MSKRNRLIVLSAIVIVAVGSVMYVTTKDTTPLREQGLVGPKGPAPTNVRR